MRTPEQIANGQKLVDALRFLEAERKKHRSKNVYVQVPGDGMWKWDFGATHYEKSCGTLGCAMGVAKALGIIDTRAPWYDDMVDPLGISPSDARAIFLKPQHYGIEETVYDGFNKVHPGMVADKLDELFKR